MNKTVISSKKFIFVRQKMVTKTFLPPQAVDKIKESLTKSGITQEEFSSQYLHVSHRSFQYWLSGKREIPFKQLDKIQEHLHLSILDIFGYFPNGYESTTTNIFDLLKRLIKINISQFGKDKSRLGLNYYAKKLASVVHIHPFPTQGFFRVVDVETSENNMRYYLTFAIKIEDPSCLCVGDELVIGVIIDNLRVRFDYGKVIIRDGYLEVEETFTSLFSRHNVSIDQESLQRNIPFKLVNWIGDDGAKFVVYSQETPFEIEIDKKINETDIHKENVDGVVVFRKGVWH